MNNYFIFFQFYDDETEKNIDAEIIIKAKDHIDAMHRFQTMSISEEALEASIHLGIKCPGCEEYYPEGYGGAFDMCMQCTDFEESLKDTSIDPSGIMIW